MTTRLSNKITSWRHTLTLRLPELCTETITFKQETDDMIFDFFIRETVIFLVLFLTLPDSYNEDHDGLPGSDPAWLWLLLWAIPEVLISTHYRPPRKHKPNININRKRHRTQQNNRLFHNSCLTKSRWNQQKRFTKRDWTLIAFLAVIHSNHYTRMFSVLVWGCNWILFMHEWFCQSL